MFELAYGPISPLERAKPLYQSCVGAMVFFEGMVRDHHQGRSVHGLFYQAYDALALTEGAKIMTETRAMFDIDCCVAVHRLGELKVGDLAVWIGAGAAHRKAAFDACQFAIDAIKRRVPIWKKEFYADGESVWLHP